MGCDIHFKVEMQGGDGTWVRAEDVGPNPWHDPESHGVWGQKEIRQDWYDGRNYGLFGILADVRGEGPALIDPRGLPSDVSKETQDEYNDWRGDAHTPHYYTLRELLDNIVAFSNPEVYGKEFVSKVIDRMRDLSDEELEGNADRIRCVFWFDN